MIEKELKDNGVPDDFNTSHSLKAV